VPEKSPTPSLKQALSLRHSDFPDDGDTDTPLVLWGAVVNTAPKKKLNTCTWCGSEMTSVTSPTRMRTMSFHFQMFYVLLKYSKATRNNFATSALMHAFQFSWIFSFLRPAPLQLLIGLLRIWPLVSIPGIPVPESNQLAMTGAPDMVKR
jgi:hypothetical protein